MADIESVMAKIKRPMANIGLLMAEITSPMAEIKSLWRKSRRAMAKLFWYGEGSVERDDAWRELKLCDDGCFFC